MLLEINIILKCYFSQFFLLGSATRPKPRVKATASAKVGRAGGKRVVSSKAKKAPAKKASGKKAPAKKAAAKKGKKEADKKPGMFANEK